jgi:hypothetical protein
MHLGDAIRVWLVWEPGEAGQLDRLGLLIQRCFRASFRLLQNALPHELIYKVTR